MENPASWGPAEKIIARVLREHQEDLERGVIGWSAPMAIADALRRADLLIGTQQNRERDDLDEMLDEIAADPDALAAYEDALRRDEGQYTDAEIAIRNQEEVTDDGRS